jgi:peroxiredoxin
MKANSLLIAVSIFAILALFLLNTRIESKAKTEQIIQKLVIGSSAPDFKLNTIDGDTFWLAAKKGKTVILFGMAGWCGTCIPEGRALTQIRKMYTHKGVEVIGVAFTKGDNENFLKEFREIGTVDIPMALDTDDVASKYQLTHLETTYIINKDGIVVYKDEEFTDFNTYKKELYKII